MFLFIGINVHFVVRHQQRYYFLFLCVLCLVVLLKEGLFKFLVLVARQVLPLLISRLEDISQFD